MFKLLRRRRSAGTAPICSQPRYGYQCAFVCGCDDGPTDPGTTFLYPPGDVRVVEAHASSVTLEWSASYSAVEFEVVATLDSPLLDPDEVTDHVSVRFPIRANGFYTIEGLIADRPYYLTVQAWADNGAASGFSDLVVQPAELVMRWGEWGGGPGQFYSIVDAACHPSDGALYTLDRESRRIQMFSLGGEEILSWGPDGVGYAMSSPASLEVDSQGTILVSDSPGRLLRFTSDGVFVEVIDVSAAIGGSVLVLDFGVAVSGEIWLVTFQPHSVYRMDASGSNASRIGEDFLTTPKSLVVHENGDAFVSDSGHVKRISSDGALIGSWTAHGGQTWDDPDLDVDPEGHVVVTPWLPGSAEAFTPEGEFAYEIRPLLGSSVGRGLAFGAAGEFFAYSWREIKKFAY